VQIFPGCKIDLFTKGTIAPIVFQNYHQVQDIINLPRKHFSDLTSYCSAWLSLRKIGYDLVINVEERSSSGRLATKFARSKYKFFGGRDYNIEVDTDEYQHIAKKPVYDLRHFCGIQNIDRDVELLDLKLSQPEIDAGRSVLN